MSIETQMTPGTAYVHAAAGRSAAGAEGRRAGAGRRFLTAASWSRCRCGQCR